MSVSPNYLGSSLKQNLRKYIYLKNSKIICVTYYLKIRKHLATFELQLRNFQFSSILPNLARYLSFEPKWVENFATLSVDSKK